MVVAAFLSGLPLTPRSPPYVYALPALALFLGQDPLWVLPACTCTVSWAVGDSLGSATPSLCRAQAVWECPFFCLSSLWVVLQARRAPPLVSRALDHRARQHQLHRGCK